MSFFRKRGPGLKNKGSRFLQQLCIQGTFLGFWWKYPKNIPKTSKLKMDFSWPLPNEIKHIQCNQVASFLKRDKSCGRVSEMEGTISHCLTWDSTKNFCKVIFYKSCHSLDIHVSTSLAPVICINCILSDHQFPCLLCQATIWLYSLRLHPLLPSRRCFQVSTWKVVWHKLHPGRLTWNLRIHPWKRKIIFQTLIFTFHVSFRGGNGPMINISFRPNFLRA